MYCDQCDQKMEEVDCDDCRGTGIGYPPPEARCIHCKGRGYRWYCKDCQTSK